MDLRKGSADLRKFYVFHTLEATSAHCLGVCALTAALLAQGFFSLLKCPHNGKLTTSQGRPLTLGQLLLLGAWNLPIPVPTPKFICSLQPWRLLEDLNIETDVPCPLFSQLVAPNFPTIPWLTCCCHLC